MVERKRTSAEIREEYERLQREREERRLQQRTNPKVFLSQPFCYHCIFLSPWHQTLYTYYQKKMFFKYYLGNNQRWSRCNRFVWPLWRGFWGDAWRGVSSYWNQQDAYFPVNRGTLTHAVTTPPIIFTTNRFYHIQFRWKVHILHSCMTHHCPSLGSFDELWHCSAVRFPVYTQRKWWGQH